MEDPIAIMLKYLNVMGNISTKNNKTLVVPIPKVCHMVVSIFYQLTSGLHQTYKWLLKPLCASVIDKILHLI